MLRHRCPAGEVCSRAHSSIFRRHLIWQFCRVKHYDNLVLYRYFLISDNRYNSCFPGEPYPDFKYAEKISSSGETFDDDTLGSKELEQSKFIELLYNVKLREGYSDANVEEEIEDIFDFLGNYSKDDIKKEIEKIINNNSKQV